MTNVIECGIPGIVLLLLGIPLSHRCWCFIGIQGVPVPRDVLEGPGVVLRSNGLAVIRGMANDPIGIIRIYLSDCHKRVARQVWLEDSQRVIACTSLARLKVGAARLVLERQTVRVDLYKPLGRLDGVVQARGAAGLASDFCRWKSAVNQDVRGIPRRITLTLCGPMLGTPQEEAICRSFQLRRQRIPA